MAMQIMKNFQLLWDILIDDYKRKYVRFLFLLKQMKWL